MKKLLILCLLFFSFEALSSVEKQLNNDMDTRFPHDTLEISDDGSTLSLLKLVDSPNGHAEEVRKVAECKFGQSAIQCIKKNELIDGASFGGRLVEEKCAELKKYNPNKFYITGRFYVFTSLENDKDVIHAMDLSTCKVSEILGSKTPSILLGVSGNKVIYIQMAIYQ